MGGVAGGDVLEWVASHRNGEGYEGILYDILCITGLCEPGRGEMHCMVALASVGTGGLASFRAIHDGIEAPIYHD